MNGEIEYHWTQSQRGAPALQIGTDLYRIQKKNKNGTIRFTCTDERCNASVTLHENKIKFMRGIHRHQERVLPFHVGEMVHEFRQTAVNDLRTPLPQIYDQLTKKFVCFSVQISYFEFFYITAKRIWISS
jgi:5-hydroxyisourate hydrolase-like protein (transthyretin family)